MTLIRLDVNVFQSMQYHPIPIKWSILAIIFSDSCSPVTLKTFAIYILIKVEYSRIRTTKSI